MRFIETFHLAPFLDTVVSYVTAFILGTLIGLERQFRQRNAGLRTNVLVAIGATGFVDLAQGLAGDEAAVRVIAYVVSGIGFLGAGVIMKEGLNVRGLNTAATLWCSAAVGAYAGVDKVAEATLMTVFIIVCNTMLRPLASAINRIPIKTESIEATYSVHVTTETKHVDVVRDALKSELKSASYPVAEIEVIERRDGQNEIIATLASTELDPTDLDGIVERVRKQPDVTHASWTASTQS
ncbi:MgtC/SapB family protein [Hyphomicrobium sp.]|jgi:putative Mg2+ transporter-C (MgtC) family protein|uniref:MgtC/SapB family protein n=1 Tax=Hyphomicrobium sp. TaxID=82 RepID=UPI0035646BE2